MSFRKSAILLICLLPPCFGIEVQTNKPALAHVRRIYVDQLGGGRSSDQLQDMILAAIQNTGLFTITENRDNADAILKGSGEESVYNDTHSSSDSIGLHTAASTSSGSSVRSVGSSSSHQSGSIGVSQNETSRSDERRREAVASVRLVAVDGDVIWSTTQESQGAKFRGSMADVADKIARKLAEETSRARVAARKASAPEATGQ